MKINIGRLLAHIDKIAEFGETPGAGSTRPSFSPSYRAACDYVADHARALGMSARYDCVGNLRIRRAGRRADAPAILIASHLDSVRQGGKYDGVLGVVAGLEILESLTEHWAMLEAPIELISFVEEEGASFQAALVGSKAVCGQLGIADLNRLRQPDGGTFLEAARAFGCNPDRFEEDQLTASDIACCFEIHIEQGKVLENEGVPIGLVNAIAGSFNLAVDCSGQANHAGTTPMNLRRDALCGFAEIALAAEEMATHYANPKTVATVGKATIIPNAPNVVPGAVNFTIDIRDVDVSALATARDALQDSIREICSRRNLRVDIRQVGYTKPVSLSQPLVDRVANRAEKAGLEIRHMHSGALHDSMALARVAPTMMIFVPSRQGISHSAVEFSEADHIEIAANLLLDVICHEQ